MRILIVEDDHPIASILRLGLEGARYQVDVAEEGEDGLRMALSREYDLIILDLMLPGLSGWELCGALRAQRRATPILMLTACDSMETRIQGLEAGADDYLAKPFHFPELLARVQALLRRNQVHKTRTIRIADLEIDTMRAHVVRCGREVPLTRPEYAVLELLAANEGRVFSWTTLHERLPDSPEGTLDPAECVLSLQRKIDDGHPEPLIHAVGGVGYTLHGPDPVASAA